MRRVFIHLHIPKCGGSTVIDILEKAFGSRLATTDSILNEYQYSAAQIARIIDLYPSMQCLTGHKLSLDLPFNRKDIDLQAITWIRDPVERFVSHYFFHRNHTHFVPETKTMDLIEYTEWALENKKQSMYINGQTRFLSRGSIKTIESLVNDGRLLLFPLSNIQESFFTLCHKFSDTFADITVKYKNPSKKDLAIPDNIRSLILPYVEKDMHLLNLARQTELKRVSPRRRQCENGNKFTISKRWALKIARFLIRSGRYIQSRC